MKIKSVVSIIVSILLIAVIALFAFRNAGQSPAGKAMNIIDAMKAGDWQRSVRDFSFTWKRLS